MRSLRRLWPRSLGARLVPLLIAALAVAQAALVFLLHGEQNRVVEEMVHGQALGQTVALARLLDQSPVVETDKLLRAFGSKQTCAQLSTGPVAQNAMSAGETELAGLLKIMLHGVKAGAPSVAISPVGAYEHPCQDPAVAPRDLGKQSFANRVDAPNLAGRTRVAAVAMTVPLVDGRVLTMRTAVSLPGGWNPAALLSFVFSSLAVAAVVVVVVHTETRSLTKLADAAERLGRGEAVALSEAGPSEVVSVIRAFNTMQERLSLYLRDRLRLLAGISHDLRTPLTTLRLKAEFVEDEAVRDDIIATIDELTVICEATLAFSRAEATAEATTTVDLAELVDEVVASFQLAKADVTIVGHGHHPCACRPVALKRAVRNLVENAVRYGTLARVSIETLADAHVIAIDDDGPGIANEEMEEAFKPFVRIEPSRNPETGGIGLGLAIARSIVRAHGGTLALTNRSPHGIRAEIRLPIPKA